MWNLQDYLPYIFGIFLAFPFLSVLNKLVALKKQELKMKGFTEGNQARVQAYERMTLFLERIKPSNLIQRFDKNLQPHEFVYLTEKNIQEEFDYNAAQQLYLSKTSWQNIYNSKAKMIKILHDTYQQMGQDASLDEYKTIFMMNYMNEEDFILTTIDDLRREYLLINVPNNNSK